MKSEFVKYFRLNLLALTPWSKHGFICDKVIKLFALVLFSSTIYSCNNINEKQKQINACDDSLKAYKERLDSNMKRMDNNIHRMDSLLNN